MVHYFADHPFYRRKRFVAYDIRVDSRAFSGRAHRRTENLCKARILDYLSRNKSRQRQRSSVMIVLRFQGEILSCCPALTSGNMSPWLPYLWISRIGCSCGRWCDRQKIPSFVLLSRPDRLFYAKCERQEPAFNEL